MQSLISTLETNSAQCGLDINQTKTQFMVLGNLPAPTLTVSAGQLEQVFDYKYLGVHIDIDADITMRIAQAWAVMRQLTPAWRSTTLTLASKYKLWRSLVEPILLYGTSVYPLTRHREARLCGCVTRMLRYIRGSDPTQHLTLAEIYSTQGTEQLDIPQITTSIVVRQLTMLMNTASKVPTHPLISLLLRNPPGKKIASRQLLLRDQITERLAAPLTLANLIALDANRIHDLAQVYEQAVYDRAAAQRARHHARILLATSLNKVPLPDEQAEDTPLNEIPQYTIPTHRSLDKRLREFEHHFPGQLGTNVESIIETYRVPKRSAAFTGTPQPPGTLHLWVNYVRNGASIYHSTNSAFNRAIPSIGMNPTDTLINAIHALLVEFKHTPLHLHLPTHKAIKKLQSLPRLYYRRLLRKHILWKATNFLLRTRPTHLPLSCMKDEPQAALSLRLAELAALNLSPAHLHPPPLHQ
jgi:hypothetical protein